jgi:hypothetical protein
MRAILAALLFAGLGVGAGSWAQSIQWPPLPREGFIVGRAATKADVEAGNAVFVAADGDRVIGNPIALDIPQYAYFNDRGVRVPAIVLQAEEARGKKLLGARLVNGQFVAGLITDFTLLGKERPNSAP